MTSCSLSHAGQEKGKLTEGQHGRIPPAVEPPECCFSRIFIALVYIHLIYLSWESSDRLLHEFEEPAGNDLKALYMPRNPRAARDPWSMAWKEGNKVVRRRT
mmetsp:Transcript_8558/g.25722  ORF Transcript_8558/g.25722 Transcript_8558/m.25722 type:complete len:102 (+) Transcript_8558:966-1271(+)